MTIEPDRAATDRPIRVLHVFHELRRSGAESMMATAHDLWAPLGIDCELVAVGETVGDFAPDLAGLGYRIHHLRPTRLALLGGFLGLVLRRRPQVVHLHTERANFWLALEARLLGRRVIQSVHTMFPFTGSLRTERRIQRRIARMLGVVYVSVGPSVARHEAEVFDNPTVVIRNWVDLERFAPPTPTARADARRSVGVHDDEFMVLSVGNCWSMKNHMLIIAAMDEPAMPAEVVYLHVGDDSVGSGPDEKRRAAGASNAGAIRFLGSRSDVPTLLHAADLFIMPSDYEGSAVSVIEALATGTPALVSDAPGLRDFRELCDSVRLTALDPASIAESIATVVAERRRTPADADEGRRVAENWFDPAMGAARFAALARRGARSDSPSPVDRVPNDRGTEDR